MVSLYSNSQGVAIAETSPMLAAKSLRYGSGYIA
jgi:hypothetical protein